ncbi:MAG TPA: AEC family transporter [Rhodospirillales bacterium]|jgi:hypothetical protein|nr:AEC family transporter [Rhodospirillales bacterium]
MTPILFALAPVFLLIFLGYLLKTRQLVADVFWAPAEKLTFYLFFPALLVGNTATAELTEIQVLPMTAAMFSGLLLIAGMVILFGRRFAADGPAFTSLLQGAIRPNTYVGIAAAFALFGDAGLTLLAVCIVVTVPIVNLLSVVVLVRHGVVCGASAEKLSSGWQKALFRVATNPLILACLLGALLNFSGIGTPSLAAPLLDILGRAALPVGLLAVGAGLDLAAARQAGRLVAVITAIKLIALPAVTFLACKVFAVGGLTATICVMYASLPGSASAYVMARQMGGDAKLMAGIITATTLAAMAAMPVAILVLGGD